MNPVPADPALPLAGKRVVVTRSASQASGLSDRLRALGAEPVEVTTIAIEPPADGGAALRRAVRAIGSYARVAVASPNGARALAAALELEGAVPPFPEVGCVGPSTARALDGSGLRVDVVPARSVAEGLVDAIGPAPVVGARLLLVQAEVARTVLADGLAERGWVVDRVVAYRTVDGTIDPEAAAGAATADAITFTSSSTVERFVRLVGPGSVPATIVSIGPITSETVRQLGFEVTVEAAPHDLDGLVDALVAWAAASP